MLIGANALEKLKNARVAVFGVGGVGGYVVEALVRAGVGEIDVIDNDTVSVSNINRQIIALSSTVGQLKTDVIAKRAKDINPDVKVHTHNLFFLPETPFARVAYRIPFSSFTRIYIEPNNALLRLYHGKPLLSLFRDCG